MHPPLRGRRANRLPLQGRRGAELPACAGPLRPCAAAPAILGSTHKGRAIIVIDGVSLSYGKRGVLKSVSLAIPPGVNVLLGPNGAGKTTLLNCLAGVSRPLDGRVEYNNRDVFAPESRKSYFRLMSWLPQSMTFPPRMTALEVVLFAAWLKEIPSEQQQDSAARALARVGLADFLHRRMGTLSGGEARRAALATALVSQPTVLLLDEPTAGLDPIQRSQLYSILEEIAEDKVTVVLSTHLLEDVLGAADVVWIVNDGRVTSGPEIHVGSGQSTRKLSLTELQDHLENVFTRPVGP